MSTVFILYHHENIYNVHKKAAKPPTPGRAIPLTKTENKFYGNSKIIPENRKTLVPSENLINDKVPNESTRCSNKRLS